MAKVKCEVCGKNMLTTSNNSSFNNGIWTHKKCPNSGNVLSEEELAQKRELTDAIKWVTDKQHKPLSKKEWVVVGTQIKRMTEQGYSYKDQLKAFKHYFDPARGEEYKGYGIMEYVIERVLLEIKDQAESVNNEEEMKRRMEEKRKQRLGL